MSETTPTGALTDDDVRGIILRSLRLAAIVTGICVPLVWWKLGWPSAVYLIVGAAISTTGIFESFRLMNALMRRMELQMKGETAEVPLKRPVLVGFFLRMGIALVVLYVSLKTLDGSVYALASGLLLGVIALSIEGMRTMRPWSV